MACRLIGIKPLSEPMLEYCWFETYEQTSVKFVAKFINFHSRKCIRKCRMQNAVYFVSGPMCLCGSTSLGGNLPSFSNTITLLIHFTHSTQRIFWNNRRSSQNILINTPYVATVDKSGLNHCVNHFNLIVAGSFFLNPLLSVRGI